MPESIEFSWSAYASYFPQQQTAAPAGNIAGVVVDGSSKKG